MTPRGNGVVNRIKHVLETHEIDDQSLVNSLLLEAMVEVDTNLQGVQDSLKQHAEVHQNIKEENREKSDAFHDLHEKIDERVSTLEKVIFFPRDYPKRFGVMVLGALFFLNLWFISGFRAVILQGLNAPPWLINLLAPGYLP